LDIKGENMDLFGQIIANSNFDNELDILKSAYQVANMSKDPSTQTGAVLINTEFGGLAFVSAGYNNFPRNVGQTEERMKDRDTKLAYIEHAERNAIFSAAQIGYSIRHLTLYAPWFACADCGRAIIQAGIKEVVGHTLMDEITPDRWKQSIDFARRMMLEAGVKMRWISAPIEGVNIRFNGQLISLVDGKPISDPKLVPSSV